MIDEKIKVKVIEGCVGLFEKECSGEKLYDECIKKMKKISLQNITEQEAEDVIKHFLYNWGRMGRVLGRAEFKGWEKKLIILIRKYSEKLGEFRRKNFTNAKLKKFENEIKELYNQFRKVLGKVAAVKALHLICPNFFPLWDNEIAKAVSKTSGFYEEDYFRFIQETQSFVKKYKKIFSALATQYEKNKLRILDEFLWWITHEQLSLLFKYEDS